MLNDVGKGKSKRDANVLLGQCGFCLCHIDRLLRRKERRMKPRLAVFVSAVTSYTLAYEAIDAIHHASTFPVGYALSGIATLTGAIYVAVVLRYLRLSGYPQFWPVLIIAIVALGSLGFLALGYVDRREGFAIYFLPVIPILFLKRRTGGWPRSQ